ncbi:hypothetical protein H6A35_03535 [Collinsella tanakaei]|nr:hypothetical protein [Collinsella tanakaei]MBM6776342.1 hypothetical protein [Collinsella tanakaei]
MLEANFVSIRITQKQEQKVHKDIRRIIGLMPARFTIGLIDNLNLEANPRNSRLGSVTDAIIESIQQDEQSTTSKLFPFKSKGILLAASRYEELERDRYILQCVDLNTEGILDGGHNTLAIGTYILFQAAKATGNIPPKKRSISIWEEFKKTWMERREQIQAYLDELRDSDAKAQLIDNGIGTLDFSVPIELLLPTEQDSELCLENFRTSLLEICDARNNNAQLTQATKANQEGIFDAFNKIFKQKDPEFADCISWKTNDGKRVESRTLVALSWIPISKTKWVTGDEKIIDAPAASSIYNSKEKCLDKFLQLMRRPEITDTETTARRVLTDPVIRSALEVAADLPGLFDMLYEMFPECYNRIGNFGRIGAVKGLLNKRGEYRTPFLQKPANRPVPDAYVYPLVFGLRALMQENKLTHYIEWATDPYEFVQSEYCKQAVVDYCGVIQQSDYDPQKVGKGSFSYVSAENAMKLAFMSYQQERG